MEKDTKSSIFSGLASLFSTNDAGTAKVIAQDLKLKLDQAATETAQLKQTIKDMEAAKAAMEAENVQLKADLAEKENNATTEVSGLEEKFNQLSGEFAEFKKQFETLKAEKEAVDTELSATKETVETKTTELAAKTKEVEDTKVELAAQTKAVEDKTLELTKAVERTQSIIKDNGLNIQLKEQKGGGQVEPGVQEEVNLSADDKAILALREAQDAAIAAKSNLEDVGE